MRRPMHNPVDRQKKTRRSAFLKTPRRETDRVSRAGAGTARGRWEVSGSGHGCVDAVALAVGCGGRCAGRGIRRRKRGASRARIGRARRWRRRSGRRACHRFARRACGHGCKHTQPRLERKLSHEPRCDCRKQAGKERRPQDPTPRTCPCHQRTNDNGTEDQRHRVALGKRCRKLARRFAGDQGGRPQRMLRPPGLHRIDHHGCAWQFLHAFGKIGSERAVGTADR